MSGAPTRAGVNPDSHVWLRTTAWTDASRRGNVATPFGPTAMWPRRQSRVFGDGDVGTSQHDRTV